MTMNNHACLPGLDSFIEDVYGLDDVSREAQPELARHNNMSAIVDQILREPDDDVAIQHPNLTQRECDLIRLQRNQMSSGSSASTSLIPPLVHPLVQPLCGTTNPLHVNSGCHPTSFRIYSDSNYQKPQVMNMVGIMNMVVSHPSSGAITSTPVMCGTINPLHINSGCHPTLFRIYFDSNY